LQIIEFDHQIRMNPESESHGRLPQCLASVLLYPN
jgi:hypothetical protein